MGRDKRNKRHDNERIDGPFIALPWHVVDSPAYMGLSHPAKALLIEIGRQFTGTNNGRLLASRAYLSKREWNSQDVITRALSELITAKLIHKTVQGHRPNKASWFAVTWRKLHLFSGYDAGSTETFVRGGYISLAIKNESLKPYRGTKKLKTVPPNGLVEVKQTPSDGAVVATFSLTSKPSNGDHLDKPSAVSETCLHPDANQIKKCILKYPVNFKHYDFSSSENWSYINNILPLNVYWRNPQSEAVND